MLGMLLEHRKVAIQTISRKALLVRSNSSWANLLFLRFPLLFGDFPKDRLELLGPDVHFPDDF